MHTAPFDYQKPTSIDQALNMLSAEGARALAGGHSLLPAMKLRLASPETLVDLAGIAELNGIFIDRGSNAHIGAMTTHTAIAESPHLGVLSETAKLIGDRQVRNRGTIGGSVAHADPAADYPTVLVAVGADIVVRGPDGSRTVPADEFFVDLFTTALQPGELVTGIDVHTSALEGGVYEKHKHPASGYAVVGVCVAGDMVVGGATGAPVKVPSRNPDDIPGVITNPIGDVYASGEYRVHLATILAKRALARL